MFHKIWDFYVQTASLAAEARSLRLNPDSCPKRANLSDHSSFGRKNPNLNVKISDCAENCEIGRKILDLAKTSLSIGTISNGIEADRSHKLIERRKGFRGGLLSPLPTKVKEAGPLYQTILNDANFYRQLRKFDEDLAEDWPHAFR